MYDVVELLFAIRTKALLGECCGPFSTYGVFAVVCVDIDVVELLFALRTKALLGEKKALPCSRGPQDALNRSKRLTDCCAWPRQEAPQAVANAER